MKKDYSYLRQYLMETMGAAAAMGHKISRRGLYCTGTHASLCLIGAVNTVEKVFVEATYRRSDADYVNHLGLTKSETKALEGGFIGPGLHDYAGIPADAGGRHPELYALGEELAQAFADKDET